MAIRDTSKKPYIIDNDSNVKVGIDLPIRRGERKDGWFASTDTTIKAVKNNIRNLLMTERGERFMQPNLGLGLRNFLFEQFTDETRIKIENQIVDTFNFWLPFVEIKELEVNMMNSDDYGSKNKLNINITFNIKRNPMTHESVQVEIGE